MAITFTAGAVQDFDSSTTQGSWSHDGGASPKAAVVVVTTKDNDHDAHAPTYGGQAMSLAASYERAVPEGQAYIYVLLDPPSGEQTVTCENFTNADKRVCCYTLDADGPVAVHDEAGGNGLGVDPRISVDSGATWTQAIVCASTNQATTNVPTATTTEDYDTDGFLMGHEAALQTGSRYVGWTRAGGSDMVVAAVLFTLTQIDLGGGRAGMSLGVHAGALTHEGIVQLAYRRVRGLLLGLRRGAISITAKRQVALVGEGLETPEMTEGGTEGQVLTQHVGRKPTWEDAAAGAAALDDLTDVDAPSPDDGDVLAWDDGAGEWVPVAPGTPDLGAASLDDIGDVDAAAPDDGDVLTWSDGDSAWVAAPPGGVSALGDLSDVTVTGSETDGQVLTSDGAGGFAFEDAAGGANPQVGKYTSVTRVTDQAFSGSYAVNKVTWTAEAGDSEGWTNLGSYGTRVATVDEDGLYALWAHLAMGTDASGEELQMHAYRSGSQWDMMGWYIGSGSFYARVIGLVVIPMTAGQYVEVAMLSNGASTLKFAYARLTRIA